MTSRRHFMTTLTLGCCATLLSAQRAPEAKRPNILFIMTDQQRGDWMGCMGDPYAITPNLDALAQDGILFKYAYSTTPTCTPARAILLTGQDPWHNGMLGYADVAKSYPNDCPKLLAQAGYTTAAFGKQHFNNHPHGYQQQYLYEGLTDFPDAYRTWMKKHYPQADPESDGLGWNAWQAETWPLPEDAHPTRWLADRTIEWLDSYNQDTPFMLKVSFHRPHSPYDPPKRWLDAFQAKTLPPPNVAPWAKHLEFPPTKVDQAAGKMPPDQVAFTRKAYRANIAYIDEQIGRLIAYLKQHDLYENTLILFTSDHGDMRGDHNLWRKGYPYEGSTRIPMILRVPQSMGHTQRNVTLTNPVELRDVAPTFLNTAGVIKTPQPMQGKSLLSLAFDHGAPWRKWIDLEHSTCYFRWNQWTAVTDGKKKYIWFAGNATEQFFDLDKDPNEMTDLSKTADPAIQTEITRWRDILIKHLQPRGKLFVNNGRLQKRTTTMTTRAYCESLLRKAH